MKKLLDVHGVIGVEQTPFGPRPVILEREADRLLTYIAAGDSAKAGSLARDIAHRLRLAMGWSKF